MRDLDFARGLLSVVVFLAPTQSVRAYNNSTSDDSPLAPIAVAGTTYPDLFSTIASVLPPPGSLTGSNSLLSAAGYGRKRVRRRFRLGVERQFLWQT